MLLAGGAAARQARTPAPPTAPIFRELTGAGLDFVHFNGMSGEFYMPEINSGGGGLVDVDGDGDLDLYLVQGTMLGPGKTIEDATFPPRHPLPLTDRLYRNDLEVKPDGTPVLRFTDVTAQAGQLPGGYGFGVAAADYDRDGDVDLYVTQLGSNALLANDGHGRFTDVTAKAGADDDRWSIPAAWADYDGDGWLDLFVGNYLDFTFKNHKVCRTTTGARDYCGPSAYLGVPDRLLHNDGDGTFTDVTVAAGLHRTPTKALGVVAADIDGDGRLDFYVASDQTPNYLWIQHPDGTFTDEALLAGCAVNGAGKAEASMGVDAGDFDGDGDLDLFMTHLVRETNTLFLNDGGGMFEDASSESGLGLPSWAHTSWGTAWFDYDNDGRLEVMTANGAVLRIEALANAGDPYPFHETNQLFHNVGNGRFEEVTEAAGPAFGLSEVSRAVAVGDVDDDGDPDVLLVNNNGPARLLLNQVGQDRGWLGLRLVDAKTGSDVLGSRVELLRPDTPPLWRWVRTDGSFAASRDPRLLFGLGDQTRIEAVRVHWPDGAIEEWKGLAPGRYHTLVRGAGRLLS